MFQSARPRGARPTTSNSTHSLISFNPRARVGRDTEDAYRAASAQLFQSARPRGARHARVKYEVDEAGFNPRARVGRDDSLGCLFCGFRFNPRARVGRD